MADLPPTSSRGAAARTIETRSAVGLTVVVLATLVAVVAAIVSETSVSAPAPAAAVGSFATPAAPAAAQGMVASARSVASAPDAGSQDGVGFTLGELAAGEVSPQRFDAFWQAELERIRTAPCPTSTGPGATAVVVDVGSTAPAHLAEDYVDYAPLLTDARAAVATACA